MADAGAPRTELQELQLKSNQVTDEVSEYGQRAKYDFLLRFVSAK